MKKSFVQKHPLLAAILIGLLCTIMTALGAAVSQIMELDTYKQLELITVFLLISIVIGIVIMKKSRYKLNEYGFRINEIGTFRKIWWYTPLLVIEVLPIVVYGFSSEITSRQYIIIALFTIAVGFNEEIYFRGLALKFLEEKGRKKSIIGSSIIFGVLHLVNALNGKNALYIVLQMFFAFLVGIVFAEIVSITKSLWVVIIWHSVHDFIGSSTGDALDSTALVVLAIQVVILLVYAICIWKASDEEETRIVDNY